MNMFFLAALFHGHLYVLNFAALVYNISVDTETRAQRCLVVAHCTNYVFYGVRPPILFTESISPYCFRELSEIFVHFSIIMTVISK